MDELLKLKKSLKLWETEFYKQHGKKPGKADIDEASSDIQDCYTKYTKIKKILKETGNQSNQSAESTSEKAASLKKSEDNDKLTNGRGGTDLANQNEEESADKDGEENIEVWGSQFDRKSSSVKEKEKLPAQKKENNAYLQKLGSKMFQQSLKQNRKGSTQRPKSWRFQSQNMLTNNGGIAQEDDVENMTSEDLLSKEIDEMTDTGQTDKEMATESEETAANFGKLFEKASSISKPKTENSKDDVSDCFIGKFKSRLKPKQTVLPSSLSKVVSLHKEKYGEPDYEALSCDQDGGNFGGKKTESADIDEFDNEFEKEFQKAIVERSTYTEWKRDESNKSTSKVKKDFKAANEIKSDFDTQVASDIKSDSRAKEVEISTVKEPSATKSTVSRDNVYEFENENTDTKSPIKFARGKRTRVSRVKSDKDKMKNENTDSEKTDMVSEADKEDYDVNCDDDSDDDNVGGKRKRKRKTESGTDKKPVKRRKTAPGCAAETDDGESTATMPVRKPVAKSKPVSSDNFIKLNMKIKTYKRKGKTMSGPQYKRKMWKQKMQARSKSYGDSCFKCGQSGHWANKCPGNQSSGTSSTGEPVMDEDFPSLQEAAMLARGVKVEEQRKLKTVSDTIETDKADTQTEPAPNIGSIEDDEELRLEAGIVRSRLDDPPPPPAMDPLIQIGENDPIPEIPDFVKKGLKKFGFDSFRPGQEESVMRILCGLSTLVVLSTGGGKSLCYQLPAYLYAQRSKCITLVVSPLVSLMEDQVTGLPQGIRGVCLHTNMTASQRESVLGAVKDGKAQFLLVSPEAIAGGSMSLVSSMSSLPPIAFACIDEAHCLSEWSHNFRPSYLRLCKVLKDKLGVRCFLGLTATATLSTASDVSRHLGITDFRRATVRGSPIPDNLYLSVSRDENRDEAIVGILQGDRFCNLESIIIYCTRRDVTDRVATLIRTCLNKGVPQEVTAKKGRKKGIKLEWDAESYHAGLTPAQRKRVQNAFMSGRLRVVVATVAFGMGLDKSDVRGIIHYNMPKSFESYVQEIGRAGRDREPAQCHVFLDPEGKDLCELRRHTYANTVDYKTLKKLVQKLFPSCRCKEVHQKHAEAVQEVERGKGEGEMDVSMEISDKERLCPGHERAMPIERTVMELDVKEEGISTLMCYLELHSQQWLENLSSVYASCKVQCYGGPNQLQAVAKKCPPVAVAIAKARKDGKSFTNTNMIEFPVVEISDAMGWSSGPVKKELKLLQWDFTGAAPRKTGIMVEFSELAYHFRSPGDLSIEELDDILQFLHTRVQKQEKSEVYNLSRLYQALKSVSHKNYWMCCDNLDMSRNDKLKAVLNEYFDSQSLEETDKVSMVTEEPTPYVSLDQVVSDIRQFHNLYGQEHSLSGRAIARIFHGIASPCFPATTWGRVRRFWRSHLDMDFNELMTLATKELIGLR